MASLKYGCIHPCPKTKEYPVAASQYFYHEGVPVVLLDGNGNLILATTTAATTKGIAIIPKGRGAGSSDDYWLSSATSGVDKIPVIETDDGYSFVFPSSETVTDAMKGNACDHLAVNDGTATKIYPSAGSTDLFIIQDLATNVVAGTAATDIIVKLNPAKRQAD